MTRSRLPAGLRAPEGFEVVRLRGSAVLLVRSDYKERLGGLVGLDPERLIEDAAASRGAGACAERSSIGKRAAGRGSVARLALDSGRALIVKKYRRGGLLAGLLPDLFLTTQRMLADLEASALALARGVPSAQAVGLMFERRFGPLQAAYLFTEEIQGSVTLAEALSRSPSGWGAIQLAREATLAVRRLHDAGIDHRDLNLGNILVREPEVFLIDLDGAEILARVSPARRFKNLSRLDRSYVKTFGNSGPLSHADRRELLGTYSSGDAALLRELGSLLNAHKRAIALHKLRWRM